MGPGCVKTCTNRECAELFSLFSSFDGDCQIGSFVIQRNRDKLSKRKIDVGVFTQPRSKAVLPTLKCDFRFTPVSGQRPAAPACRKSATAIAALRTLTLLPRPRGRAMREAPSHPAPWRFLG